MHNEHIQHKINSLIRSLRRPPTLIKNARAAQIFKSPQHPLYRYWWYQRPSNTPRVAGQHSINKTPNNHNQLKTHFPIPPKLVLPDARCCCYGFAAGWWWCCSALLMHTASRAYYLFAHRAAHYLNIIPCARCSPKPYHHTKDVRSARLWTFFLICFLPFLMDIVLRLRARVHSKRSKTPPRP